jgi:hypothetical protein
VEEWQVTTDNYDYLLHSGHNVISYNELVRCQNDSEDVGTIYLFGNGYGNVINNNIIRDHHRRKLGGIGAGIYLDDKVHGTIVKNNIIYDFDPGTKTMPFFMKGDGNVLENNIAYLDKDEGMNQILFIHGMVGQYIRDMRIQRNIFCIRGNGIPFLFSNSRRPGKPDFNAAWFRSLEGNLIDQESGADGVFVRLMEKGSKEFTESELEQYLWNGIANLNTVYADPLFVDPQAGDFRLRPESPALKATFGFEPIDMTEIGLTADFPEKFREKLGDFKGLLSRECTGSSE